jgi:hypothetical protein
MNMFVSTEKRTVPEKPQRNMSRTALDILHGCDEMLDQNLCYHTLKGYIRTFLFGADRGQVI